MSALLEVNNLVTHFNTEAGLVKAVDGVSFHLKEQEIISIVGESGCGKSVSCLSVMQLIRPPGKIVGGQVLFQGKDLLQYRADDSQMRAVRGAEIAMIFQEPMTSLNPTLTIEQQLTEMPMKHLKLSRDEARKRAVELMKMVGISDAERRIKAYPHQFSGGMRQRVMIAMALSCNPKILIADEPTTALDVTTQAQLLKLMRDLVQHFRTSLIIITHNLGLVARYAQRIYVMYAGRVIETGTTKDIFANPCHPYTLGLLRCVPRLDEEEGRTLVPIEGLPPNLINMPPGCAFLPRCPYKQEICQQQVWPSLEEVGEGHFVSCYVKPREKVR
ncbi:MAG TPA: ABC transporter ATP-binding protein [Firmicutes bacterium]|nr:ABC transporter ATP-binding protein [Bacillota bacterium]